MKKKNKRKPRKKLSTGILLSIILLFSVLFICFGICNGFLINAMINESIKNVIIDLLFTLIAGIIYILVFIVLLRDKDIERVKPIKWYIDKILLSILFTFIVTAITVITLQPSDGIINSIVGFCIFPTIGIITTPNIVKYVKNDTQRWKHIFYKNGNLENIKDSKDYYRVETPVSFEKKILSSVYKHQILNILVVIAIMSIVVFACYHYMTTDHSYTNNVVANLVRTRAKRSFGFILFLSIFFLAFAIPIVAFYISHALKKIRVVRKHEYIAYHVIASSVTSGKISIYDKNKSFKYNYCTCVGIKEKDIHNTPATLIFIPDDVLLFPDNEEYKIDKYKKLK